jgi:6-phosphogluconolactonase (cycloisomerase 2 family)
VEGLFVYKINESNHQLRLLQQMPSFNSTDFPIDMEMNEQTQLLYVLNYEKTINVYLFDPKISEKSKEKEKAVL